VENGFARQSSVVCGHLSFVICHLLFVIASMNGRSRGAPAGRWPARQTPSRQTKECHLGSCSADRKRSPTTFSSRDVLELQVNCQRSTLGLLQPPAILIFASRFPNERQFRTVLVGRPTQGRAAASRFHGIRRTTERARRAMHAWSHDICPPRSLRFRANKRENQVRQELVRAEWGSCSLSNTAYNNICTLILQEVF
jgi:hypothetical protein